MAQMWASWAVRSVIPAPEAAPSLAALATSSMASPIRARRSSVEHTLETIGQRDHDRDGFRPLRTTSPAPALRSAAALPYTSPPPPGHPPPAARTSLLRPGFSKPSFLVPGLVLGVSPASAPGPGSWLTAAYCTVDNFARNVDGEAAESFFRAQAVDGISAGSRGGGRQWL